MFASIRFAIRVSGIAVTLRHKRASVPWAKFGSRFKRQATKAACSFCAVDSKNGMFQRTLPLSLPLGSLLLLPSFLWVLCSMAGVGCSVRVDALYRDWSRSSGKGPVIARLGDIQVRAADVRFTARNRTITPATFQDLAPHDQELVLKQLLIRRRLIAEGSLAGDFNTPAARAFLLPRLERLLEEYHLRRQSAGIGTSPAVPPKAVLAAFLRGRGKDPKLAEGLGKTLQRRLEADRLKRARRKATLRILKELSPKIALGGFRAQQSPGGGAR